MYTRAILALLAAPALFGQTITTFAGTGVAGYNGDNIQATQAQINKVVALAYDGNGNVYMAEELNNRVRKVDKGGLISSVAGTGTAGFTGDNGPANLAALNAPLGVCFAPNGDLYINDDTNRRVRKIAAATGTITTVAGNGSQITSQAGSGDGGPAIAAGFYIPIRCAVDSNSNLYIVDQGVHVVRKVTPSGTISLYAGNYTMGFSGDNGPAAAASMNNPTAITMDASNNLYISDQFNHRIRRVDASTGIITTVAGNGNGAFAGDGGPATSASLQYPGETAIDSFGNLYIVDSANNRVRKVSGGIMTTIAGNGIAGYAGDNGPALQAELSNPFGMTLDGSGNLYVAEIGNNRVRKISGVVSQPGPTITSAGVTNAASFATGIAPGGIVTIFGSNLGASAGQISVASGTSWPSQVGGASVTMDGTAAPVYRVLNLNGSEQLSVQAPWSLNGKNSVSVVVTTSAGTGQAVTVPVLGAQPGIFILDAASSGATHADGSIVTAAKPATHGETVVLYLTGLGPVTNQPASGAPASLTTLSTALIQPQVTIGGFNVTPGFSGLTPGYIGLYQINVAVPAAAASGVVDLTVQANGITSNTAKIAIQ